MLTIKTINSLLHRRIGYDVEVMKTSLFNVPRVVLVIGIGTGALLTQSCAAATHASRAIALSGEASGEAFQASGDVAMGSLRVATGIVAVPVFVSAGIFGVSGAIVSSAGALSAEAASDLARGSDQMWDFATGNPAQRPKLDREKAVPPLTQPAAKPRDRSPAEMLSTRR